MKTVLLVLALVFGTTGQAAQDDVKKELDRLQGNWQVTSFNGEAVPAALVDEAMLEETGLTEYSDGWSYDPATNAIEFHGTYVPDYNSDVQIYYRPLEGNPRTLPF